MIKFAVILSLAVFPIFMAPAGNVFAENAEESSVDELATSWPPITFAVIQRESPAPRFAGLTATVIERTHSMIAEAYPDLRPLPSEHREAFESLFQSVRSQATEAYGVDLVVAVELEDADVTVLGVSIYYGLERRNGFSERYTLDRNRGLTINEDAIKLLVRDLRDPVGNVPRYYVGSMADRQTEAVSMVAAARPESVIVGRKDIKGNGGTVYESGTVTPFTGTVVQSIDGGQLTELIHFIDGRRHGLAEVYTKFPDRLIKRSAYKQGLIDGQVQVWSVYGPLLTQTQYADGVEVGVRSEWFGNGQLRLRRFIEDGEQSGMSYHWKGDGSFSHCEDSNGKKGRECPGTEHIGSAEHAQLSGEIFTGSR